MNEIESTAEEIGTELVPAPQPGTLFHTDDPVEVVEKATRIAGALKDVLHKQKMIQRIQGKDHVKVEGWVTLGAMLGVVPVVVWTKKLDRGWEARVEARTLDGRVIGAAEAECLKDETRWAKADDYAVRSMAQTRATSKALGGPLRFIVTLAGYNGTPAEEMPADGYGASSDEPFPASEAQRKLINGLCRKMNPSEDQLNFMLREIGADGVTVADSQWTQKLTGGGQGTASALITWLKEKPLPDLQHPSDVPSDPGLFEHPQEPPGPSDFWEEHS